MFIYYDNNFIMICIEVEIVSVIDVINDGYFNC